MEMRPVAIPATGGATLMDTTDEEAFLAKDQARPGTAHSGCFLCIGLHWFANHPLTNMHMESFFLIKRRGE